LKLKKGLPKTKQPPEQKGGNEMDLSTEEVKQVTQRYGADFVGVVKADKIPESIPPRPAISVLKGAKSVIVFGIRMLSGSLESPNLRVATTSNLAMYQEITHISYQLGRFLEDKGYLAAVIPPYLPIEMSRETRGLVGDLSLRHAAVGAGLGVLSKNRLLLTSQWGPRVRLGAVVSDAALQGDEPMSQEMCEDCQICINACPVSAISPEGKVDTAKCSAHVLTYGLGSFIKYFSEAITKPTEEAQRLLRDPYFWNLYQCLSVGGYYGCSRCVEVCPVGE
jgi:epoxyqueuosine reductase QueG